MKGSAHFRKGVKIEVSSDEEDFRGAWYTATIVRTDLRNNNLWVEYETLMADEEGTKPLKERIEVVNARPRAPREIDRSFKFSEEVDAFYNDGWWEGVITNVLENSRYLVYFRGTREELEFGESDLRIHREWVDEIWVPPLEEQINSSKLDMKLSEMKTSQKKVSKEKSEVKFKKGTLVEVSSDEEGFVGAWFVATIVKPIGKNKFLVEYQDLKTDDETELLREEADALHIRPYPPDITGVEPFNRLEEIDALYNDAWWVGVISKVLPDSKYIVYFRQTKEELEFGHSELRLHQDWINGKWVRASQALLF